MSTFGSMIKCEYSLLATASMDQCCNVDPQLALPILVCDSPQQNTNAIIRTYQAPANYNPQINQPVIYNLNSLSGNGVNNASQYPNYQMNAGGNGGHQQLVPTIWYNQTGQGQVSQNPMNGVMMMAPMSVQVGVPVNPIPYANPNQSNTVSQQNNRNF